MTRIVAGKSCSGKSGYAMARFQVNPTSFVSLSQKKKLQDGLIIHFPLSHQVGIDKNNAEESHDVLERIKSQFPSVEVDFLYCGMKELRARQLARTHTEDRSVGYDQIRGQGFATIEEYAADLIGWCDYFKAHEWKCNFIHSNGWKYYCRDEQHFYRTVTGKNRFTDKLGYLIGIQRPVAVRGWGLPVA